MQQRSIANKPVKKIKLNLKNTQIKIEQAKRQ